MKEVIIIKRDEQAIRQEKAAHEKFVSLINAAIDGITATGVEMSNEMLLSMFSNHDYVVQEADRQIRAEQDKLSRFKFFSRKVDTTPVTDEIREILEKLHRSLYTPYAVFYREYVTFADGRATLVEDFDAIMEEKYSIKLDTPAKEKAWELATKAKDAINELEDYLRGHSDGVHACQQDEGTWHNESLVLLTGRRWQEDYMAELYPDMIPYVNK